MFEITIDIAIDALGPADFLSFGKLPRQILVEQVLDLRFDVIGELVAIRAEKLDTVILERIVRGRNHHADIAAQRARQHGNRRCRNRAEQEHVQSRRGKAGHEGVLQHISRQARVLADHHPMTMGAVTENRSCSDADPHRKVRRHGEDVGLASDAVRPKIASFHMHSCAFRAP